MASSYFVWPAPSVSIPGVSTAANQVLQLAQETTTATKTTSIESKIPANLTVTSTRLLVDGSGVTQPVSGTFWQTTQPVSIAASVAVTGPLTDAQLRATAVPVSLTSTTITGSVAVTGPLTDTQLRATDVPVSGTFWQATQPVSLTSTTITGSVAVTGPLTDAQLRATAVPVSLTSTTLTGTSAVNTAQVNGVTTLTGNGVTGTGSQRVTIASDNTAFAVNATLSAETTKVIGTVNLATTATATLSNVSSSASSVTVLASNASRRGAMIFNDSTAVLYLKFGATASTTSYTVQIPSNAYYELPANSFLYNGILDGIWSAANGSARVTEVT